MDNICLRLSDDDTREWNYDLKAAPRDRQIYAVNAERMVAKIHWHAPTGPTGWTFWVRPHSKGLSVFSPVCWTEITECQE